MANSINISGLASGLDSSAIIKAMVAAAHVPIDRLQRQEAILNAHKSSYAGVVTALQKFNSYAQTINTPPEFSQVISTSSDNSVVTAVSGSDANAGTYGVTVNALAKAQRTYSDGFASATDTGQFGYGAISVTVGSNAPVNIAVDSTTTLQSLAAAITNSGAGLVAGITYDGANYRLQVSGSNTGTANAFTFSEAGTSLNLADPANTAQAAQDASITLDNFQTITSSSNTLNGAIQGVTLQLKSVSTTPQTVTIGPNTEGVQTQIQTFVDNYNGVMQAINAVSQFNPSVGRDPGSLVGDTSLQSLQRSLQNMISSPVPGAAGSFSALSQLGIATQQDGTLKIDTTVMQAALASDPQSVERLFVKDPTSASSNGVTAQVAAIYQQFGAFGTGDLTQRSVNIDSAISKIDTRIASLQQNLDAYQKTLQTRFNNLETVMSNLNKQTQYLTQSLSMRR